MSGVTALGETPTALETYSELYFLMGAAVYKTAVAPIDRVKSLMQAQGQAQGGMVYKGIGNCLERTLTEEGLASLWRGNVVNVARYLPAQALTFGTWELSKHYFNRLSWCPYDDQDVGGKILWCAANFAAGYQAGAVSTLCLYPLDYARSRLAMDAKKVGGERQFKGLLDLCKKTWAADGIAGFYRGGLTSLCLGNSVYRCLYLGMYGSLKPVVLTGTMQDSFLGSFGLAWWSAVVAGSVSYPIDTLRRREMVDPGRYRDIPVFIDMVGKARRRALYKGVGANMVRSIGGAAVLAAYDRAFTYSIQMKRHVQHNLVEI